VSRLGSGSLLISGSTFDVDNLEFDILTIYIHIDLRQNNLGPIRRVGLFQARFTTKNGGQRHFSFDF
jgi:hypothetical protein